MTIRQKLLSGIKAVALRARLGGGAMRKVIMRGVAWLAGLRDAFSRWRANTRRKWTAFTAGIPAWLKRPPGWPHGFGLLALWILSWQGLPRIWPYGWGGASWIACLPLAATIGWLGWPLRKALARSWNFARQQNGVQLSIVATTALSYVLFCYWNSFAFDGWRVTHWRLIAWPDAWEMFETMLKIGALPFALYVWFNESQRKWEDGLPKRLYVVFYLKGQPVLRCDNAPLLGEGDLRAFAQQIGGQMIGQLNFSLNILLHKPEIERSETPGAFKRYVACFRLDENAPVKDLKASKELLGFCSGEKKQFRYWPTAQRPSGTAGDLKNYPTDWKKLPKLPEVPDVWLNPAKPDDGTV